MKKDERVKEGDGLLRFSVSGLFTKPTWPLIHNLSIGARTELPVQAARTGLPVQAARTGLPGQGCQDRAARTRLPGQDCQERTTRIRQQDRTERRGQPEKESQTRTARIVAKLDRDSQKKRARPGQPE